MNRPRRGQQPTALVVNDVRDALRNRTFATLGLRLVQFNSEDVRPRSQVNSTGLNGDGAQVQNGQVAIGVRNLIARNLDYSSRQLWQWIAVNEGYDTTAVVDSQGRVLAATVGFLDTRPYRARSGSVIAYATYITHVTAIDRPYQGTDGQRGFGFGPFLRQMQIERLNERLDRVPHQEGYPIQVVSYSANPNDVTRGAVEFQKAMFGPNHLDFTLASAADEVLEWLERAHPHLNLAHVREQNVRALRFVDD